MEDYERDEIRKMWEELPDNVVLLSICPNCQIRITGAPQFVCDRCHYPIDEFFISIEDISKIVKSLSIVDTQNPHKNICRKCGKDFQIYGNMETMICDDCNADMNLKLK